MEFIPFVRILKVWNFIGPFCGPIFKNQNTHSSTIKSKVKNHKDNSELLTIVTDVILYIFQSNVTNRINSYYYIKLTQILEARTFIILHSIPDSASPVRF